MKQGRVQNYGEVNFIAALVTSSERRSLRGVVHDFRGEFARYWFAFFGCFAVIKRLMMELTVGAPCTGESRETSKTFQESGKVSVRISAINGTLLLPYGVINFYYTSLHQLIDD